MKMTRVNRGGHNYPVSPTVLGNRIREHLHYSRSNTWIRAKAKVARPSTSVSIIRLCVDLSKISCNDLFVKNTGNLPSTVSHKF